MGALCFLILIVAFYGFGFYLLGRSVWNARQSTQAATWPTVPATVTELELHERSGEDTIYSVKVRYRYTVDGTEYESTRLAFGYAGSSGKMPHEEIYRKLKEATSVTARYAPTDPSESCLSFGMHGSIRMLLVFSVMWMVALSGITYLIWMSATSDTVLLDNLIVQ